MMATEQMGSEAVAVFRGALDEELGLTTAGRFDGGEIDGSYLQRA